MRGVLIPRIFKFRISWSYLHDIEVGASMVWKRSDKPHKPLLVIQVFKRALEIGYDY